MYVRVAAILFPITLLAFLGAVSWGYQEYNDKNALLIKAENQYQRAFHDLNYHMDKLQSELGKTIALNTGKQFTKSMTNIWRIAYAAQSDIGQLPLSLMPFDKTEQFLARLGRFAYQVGVRDLNQKPITEKEWKTLNTLYEQAEALRNDLQTVQAKVLSENLRWLDVEEALASEDKVMDNTIIDGFKKVNLKAEQFPEVDWGPTVNNMQVRERERDQRLHAPKITAEEAKQKVASIFGISDIKRMKAVKQKGDFESYQVHYQKENQTDVYADVTVKGGYLVWMDYDRPVKQRKLSSSQALDKAQQFLERLGMNHMAPISYDEVGNIMIFSFVHQKDGVSIYPETAVVKIALDNGEIMGVQADEYVFNYQANRKQLKPRLTEAQARKKLNSHLKVQKSNLAIINNDEGQEVLCYEFLGTIDRNQYRIFINATTGEEEFVDRIEKNSGSSI